MKSRTGSLFSLSISVVVLAASSTRPNASVLIPTSRHFGVDAHRRPANGGQVVAASSASTSRSFAISSIAGTTARSNAHLVRRGADVLDQRFISSVWLANAPLIASILASRLSNALVPGRSMIEARPTSSDSRLAISGALEHLRGPVSREFGEGLHLVGPPDPACSGSLR